MRKRREKTPPEPVLEKNILQELIDAGMGHLPFSKLGDLARIFERSLSIKLVAKDGKVLHEWSVT